MKYPGRIIKQGETDAKIVKALKKRLNASLGMARDEQNRLDESNGRFGVETKRVVQLFQTRNVDASGMPLVKDGAVGSLTWEALFGRNSVTVRETIPNTLLREALLVAAGEEARGVREVPRNSNRGPRVQEYLRATGLGGGYAWCCAFTYWCFGTAAQNLRRNNPMVKTAGCLKHWNGAEAAGARRIKARDAMNDPRLLKPGMLFVMDYGKGLGHTGFIESIAGGLLTTIEGNTDASRTREGGGVYRLVRKVAEINLGYIDYGGR